MRVARSLVPAAFLACLWATASFAVQPDEVMRDPALETRARTISGQLRCLVCQNQSIDDSEAPLARDLRLLVRDRLGKGDTDRAVRDYVADRYGEFVLLRPVIAPHTLLLWFTPAALLVGGFVGLVWRYGRQRAGPPAALSADEAAALREIVGGSSRRG